jgi:hypothetical protein
MARLVDDKKPGSATFAFQVFYLFIFLLDKSVALLTEYPKSVGNPDQKILQ